MKISRRDFIKWAIALGITVKLGKDLTESDLLNAAETDPPVIWLQGAGCTGCTMATLNVTNPTTIDDVLLNKVSMKYNNSITAASGSMAFGYLDESATKYSGSYILIVEGAVPSGTRENYCTIGNLNGTEISMLAALKKYGPLAKYVISAGTCASFGGVSAASPNNTSCITVASALSGLTKNPVINLPGCPVHPTVLIQTVVNLILTGMPTLDSSSRPTAYYSNTIHSTCPRKGTTSASVGTVGCYRNSGCKGQNTYNVCSSLKWDGGKSFCVEANYPCNGCAGTSFPTNPLTV
jgi:hydrogenase small subunit